MLITGRNGAAPIRAGKLPVRSEFMGNGEWIDRAKRLVIVKMASNGMVVDTDTDRTLLAAFDAIKTALD